MQETMTDAVPGVRAPTVFWITSVAAVLWNAFGAFDYTMTHIGGEAYLRSAGLGDSAVEWFNTAPAWLTAVWAFGVWGGLAGAVLLLLRSRYAVAAFAISLAGVIVMTFATNFMHPYPPEMHTPGMTAIEWTIKLVALLLLVFAVRMRTRGILR